MFSRGIDRGQYVTVLGARGETAVTTGSMKTTFSFGKWKQQRFNGLGLGVLAFILKIPKPSFAAIASKNIDGVSLAQLIASMSLTFAGNSPPTQVPGGGREIFSGVNGYKLLTALHFMSGGFPVFVADGGDRILANVLAAGDGQTFADTDSQNTIQRQLNSGWLWDQGPYGGSDASAVAWSDDVYIVLPIGMDASEPSGTNPIPLGYFTGSNCAGSCMGDGGGELSFTLGSFVDNSAVTYGTTTFDLYAFCETYMPNDEPLPMIPRIETAAPSGIFSRPAGIHRIFALEKDLSAAGAMQASDYTDVRVTCNGAEIDGSSIVLDKMLHQAMRAAMHTHLPGTTAHFRNTFARQAEALANGGAARFARLGLPLILNNGKNSKSPGSIEHELVVDVKTSGETSFPFIHGWLMPKSEALKEAARVWNGRAAAEVFAKTEDAKAPTPSADALVPGVVRSPLSFAGAGK